MRTLLFFCVGIFLLGLFARIVSYQDTLQPAFSSFQYYQGLGSGSDADYQITNAIFAITNAGPVETLTHYDYIFLIPLLTFFLKMFGYIRGIEYTMYFIIFLGSLIPVITFYLLAQRTKPYIVGALIAGLALALNPLLIGISAGRFVLDTLVQFIFVLFIVCYLRALEKQSLVWLILLGFISFIQGLNKTFLMINDLALFLVFPLFLLIKEIRYKKTFPFLTPQWNITRKRLLYALLPSLIYFACNIAWEIYVQFFVFSKEYLAVHRGYFLMEIFFSNASDSSTNFALRDSLVNATPWEKIRNIIMLTLMAIEQLVQYLYIPIYYLISLITLYLFSKKNKKNWFLATILLLSGLTALFFYLTHTFFVHNTITPIPQNWTMITFFSFAIVIVLLLFFMQHSINLLAMTVMKIPYLVAVGLTITTAIAPRHYVTLVMWFIVCIALLIDSFMPNFLSRFSLRVHKTVIVIIFLLFALPIIQTVLSFKSTVGQERRDRQYLSWVETKLPDNSYILAGSGENLIAIAKHTNKPVLYNTFFGPAIADYSDSVSEIRKFGPTNSHLMEFKVFLPKYTKEEKLYVMDFNIPGWNQLLTTGSKAEFGKNKYKLKEFSKNNDTKRVLYQVILVN